MQIQNHIKFENAVNIPLAELSRSQQISLFADAVRIFLA